jgi:hypothetical protein
MLDAVTHSIAALDLRSYDRIVVALSGGKDSIASTLALIEAGAQTQQLLFFHHLVDGRDGSLHSVRIIPHGLALDRGLC